MFDNKHNIVKSATIKIFGKYQPNDLEILIAVSRLRPEYKEFVADIIFESTDKETWHDKMLSEDVDVIANIGILSFALRVLLQEGRSILDLTKIIDLGDYKNRFQRLVKEILMENEGVDVPTSNELSEWFAEK